MMAFALAFAMMPSACPMTVAVNADGTLFSDRFHGWYKVSPKALRNDLHNGCYNDANPSRVTSVAFLIAPKAPKAKVDLVYSILASEGWSRKHVHVQSWNGDDRVRH